MNEQQSTKKSIKSIGSHIMKINLIEKTINHPERIYVINRSIEKNNNLPEKTSDLLTVT